MESNYANRQVFTEDNEVMLAEYIITCAKTDLWTHDRWREKLPYQFATANNRQVLDSCKASKAADSEWLGPFGNDMAT